MSYLSVIPEDVAIIIWRSVFSYCILDIKDASIAYYKRKEQYYKDKSPAEILKQSPNITADNFKAKMQNVVNLQYSNMLMHLNIANINQEWPINQFKVWVYTPNT